MNAVESAFEKVLGRQPSDAERQRLYRLRDSLGLRDNDAFWAIVMALEQYDALFREYPRQLAEESARTIESARATFAAAAQSEAAHVQEMLSQRVAETSVKIARKLAERPLALHRVTTVLAAVVAFGRLCVNAGYNLASSARPFWASAERLLRGPAGARYGVRGTRRVDAVCVCGARISLRRADRLVRRTRPTGGAERAGAGVDDRDDLRVGVRGACRHGRQAHVAVWSTVSREAGAVATGRDL